MILIYQGTIDFTVNSEKLEVVNIISIQHFLILLLICVVGGRLNSKRLNMRYNYEIIVIFFLSSSVSYYSVIDQMLSVLP